METLKEKNYKYLQASYLQVDVVIRDKNHEMGIVIIVWLNLNVILVVVLLDYYGLLL